MSNALRGELAEHKVPRRIVVFDALRLGPTGKVPLRVSDFVENRSRSAFAL
jgi:hypothetical protein